MTTTDTRAALDAAIMKYGMDAASSYEFHARAPSDWELNDAIAAHVAAHVAVEVARALAAAPEVESAIEALDVDEHEDDQRIDALLAAIAADKARAVEEAEADAFIRGRDAVRNYPGGWGLIARPTPDEARRLVEDLETAAFEWGMRRNDYERATTAKARAALLRALGVEP